MSTNLSSTLETLFSKMENFVTTKTVVGEPVHIGDVIILPLVDVAFGVGAGAGAASKNDDPKNSQDGGGGGLGAKITPSAVIVVVNGQAQMINVKNQDSISKLIDMVPSLTNKLNLSSIFNKNKDKEPDVKETEFTESQFEDDGDIITIKRETTTEETRE